LLISGKPEITKHADLGQARGQCAIPEFQFPECSDLPVAVKRRSQPGSSLLRLAIFTVWHQ
jgi:hypothetical protein